MTRWDVHLLVRAAGMASAALALGWLLTAATDEGGVSWGERAGRTLPLTPLCAAVGAWGALAPVRARGEALALEALGRTRAQIAGAAVAGSAAVALVAALAMATVHAVSVDGFFPAVTHHDAWRWDGRDGFVDAGRGLRVGGDAAPVATGAEASGPFAQGLPVHARIAASLATALAGAAMTMLVGHALVTRRRRPRAPWTLGPAGRDVVAASVAVAATVILFQAAAARRLPALAGTVPAAALLALATRRFGEPA